MNFDDALSKLKKINQSLQESDPNLGKREVAMVRTIKVAEEFGELSNEILGFLGLHRKSKMDNHKFQKLVEEWTDVWMVLMLLGLYLDVDVGTAIDEKFASLISA
ncbi:MAG: hypothetical protein ACOX6V_04200 [Patescibacteria group bacterium]|jgi:NTP pyrophosphatase (non-canonical NTP hydrolase)